VTLHLEIEQTELHPGDFLSLRVTAVNDTPHGMFGFVPVTTIRVSTWPKAGATKASWTPTSSRRACCCCPRRPLRLGLGRQVLVAHALQATWDPGDYHLRYCTPILGKLVCTNTVEITVLQ